MRMPDDDRQTTQPIRRQHAVDPLPPARASRSLFQLPPVVKRVFDNFPLITLESNELPQRALVERKEHVLHIFTTKDKAMLGRPSHNPACLKWQTYLKLRGLRFHVVPSSNHASPTGVLPFLQPAGSDPAAHVTVDPITSNKLNKWLASQKGLSDTEQSMDTRYETYASLLDNRVRKAWLFQLYLAPQNAHLVHRLYVEPCSSHPFVRQAIASQLRAAAESELVKSAHANTISALDLIRDTEEGFQGLSVLLGNDEWFFGNHQPGLFDASVFAYTHLILDNDLGWSYNPLQEALSRHHNLIQHRNRICVRCFG